MIDIQSLFDRGVITNITIGKSALTWHDAFCNIRSAELEGNVQGHGKTVQEAFDNAMERMQRSLHLLDPKKHPAPATRPAPVTVQMPEVPTLRMPGF